MYKQGCAGVAQVMDSYCFSPASLAAFLNSRSMLVGGSVLCAYECLHPVYGSHIYGVGGNTGVDGNDVPCTDKFCGKSMVRYIYMGCGRVKGFPDKEDGD